jgi:hypothetical protein
MFRINFYRVSLDFSFRNTKLIVVYVIERIRTPIRNTECKTPDHFPTNLTNQWCDFFHSSWNLQLYFFFTIDRLFPSIVEMFRINFYRVSLDFSFRNTKLIDVYVIKRIRTPIRNVHSRWVLFLLSEHCHLLVAVTVFLCKLVSECLLISYSPPEATLVGTTQNAKRQIISQRTWL